MSDLTTTIQDLKNKVDAFIAEREWHQFHSPKNLSMNIAIEAAELMEKFVWITTELSRDEVNHNRKEIEDEAADVFMALLCFCNASAIDLTAALQSKMTQAALKYPVEKARGKSTKYDKL